LELALLLVEYAARVTLLLVLLSVLLVLLLIADVVVVLDVFTLVDVLVSCGARACAVVLFKPLAESVVLVETVLVM